MDVKGIKVGLTGIYELAEHEQKATQVKENIQALKDAGAQIIIVNFHWGIEKEYTPNATQKNLHILPSMKEPTLSLVIAHMYWKALKSIMENILPTVWETSVLGEIKILLIRIR